MKINCRKNARNVDSPDTESDKEYKILKAGSNQTVILERNI